MPADPARNPPPRDVDANALRRVRRRLAAADQPPWLHAEVARRMAQRLELIRLQPASVLDWWSRLGGGFEALQRAYPKARLQRVEPDDAPAAPPAAPRWWSPRRLGAKASPPLAEGGVGDGEAQLVWANMMLHLHADPPALMHQWHRALASGGFLMFSTLGPGSLASLRRVHAEAGWPSPHAPFVDMHDLGDMLVEVGFADPVMDQEMLTLTWADADALLAELRSLGGNTGGARFAGLRTRHWRDALKQRLAARATPDGRLRMEFEVVYGHAFKPPPRPRVAATTSVSLHEMRTMVATGRRPKADP